jgi:hypothetical protein
MRTSAATILVMVSVSGFVPLAGRKSALTISVALTSGARLRCVQFVQASGAVGDVAFRSQ